MAIQLSYLSICCITNCRKLRSSNQHSFVNSQSYRSESGQGRSGLVGHSLNRTQLFFCFLVLVCTKLKSRCQPCWDSHLNFGVLFQSLGCWHTSIPCSSVTEVQVFLPTVRQGFSSYRIPLVFCHKAPQAVHNMASYFLQGQQEHISLILHFLFIRPSNEVTLTQNNLPFGIFSYA